MRDIVYYFDKLSPYARHELGEIQTEFNMSFTIDGTKDSSKIVVRSFSGVEVEPYTILKHEKTGTWWCAINDKVQRYANESGFVYTHTLILNGANELFNARDLIDCGFNANTYNINQFLTRLFRLSKFDFPSINFVFGNNINQSQMVDYVKTFENYTLLSALREFLDGYNCDFKLTFTQLANGRLSMANINIIPKTGNVDLDILDEDEFQDVREIKKIDKNSFGTTVVSNAENVISSVAKTYPSIGSVRLSASGYTITSENAILRLPSKVFKVNWLKQKFAAFISFEKENDNAWGSGFYSFDDDGGAETFINAARSLIQANVPQALDDFNSKVDDIVEKLRLASTISFYEGNSINPVDGTIVKGANVPYIPTIYKNSIWSGPKQVILTDKQLGSCLPYSEQAIMWERGSDLITNFKYFNTEEGSSYRPEYSFNDSDLQDSNGNSEFFYRYPATGTYTFAICMRQPVQNIQLAKSSFVINYIPMSDLKIEIDNQRSTKDMQLYNQNGKLTDSVALSKILNSYSREISSDKITKYMYYYDFDDIPKAGQMVTINNELYVINNVSIDFYPNEDDSYYMPCEFNLCKYVSTKSLMVNPNTNIRDYGIPQNFNVKRKQLYRDYIEFGYSLDLSTDGTTYCNTLPLDFDTGSHGYTPVNHTVVIECEYNSQIGTPASYYWYYQLDTTLYRLDKMNIELLDFKDNNIIGYGSQNIHSAFQVSRIFSGLLDTINTPISYVDNNGNVKGLRLCWETSEQLENAWNEYKTQEGYSGNNDYDLTNFSVFIPSDIYDYANLHNDMYIGENEYYKDATEVPVFEYIFQVGDSDEVVVGDKILDNVFNENESILDIHYFYAYAMADAGTLNQINATKLANNITFISSIGKLNNACNIDNSNTDYMLITPYDYGSFGTTPYTNIVFNDYVEPLPNKDYAIFRYKYIGLTKVQLGQPELVMVLKNVPQSAIISETWVKIYKNKYKLK